MVALEYLRNRGAIFVAVLVGVALLAFILSDLLMPGRSMFGQNEMEVGRVGREVLNYPEYQNKVDYMLNLQRALGANQENMEMVSRQTRDQVWEGFVRNALMEKFSKRTGLTLTNEELSTLIMGNEPHPIVRQLFSNPETGEFNAEQVVMFLQGLDEQASPEQRAYWLEMEKEIASEQLQSKFSQAVKMGFGMPKALAEYEQSLGQGSVDVRYCVLPYTSVPDSVVTVTESDLKAYYKKHKALYEREERRNVVYVQYTVSPSAEDIDRTHKTMEEALEEFATTDDPGLFATQNGDTPYMGKWITREEAQKQGERFAAWLFDSASVGRVSPLYRDVDRYYAVRVMGKEMMPDSVHARHILLGFQMHHPDSAQALADSLHTLLKEGADFATLAQEYSEDPGSKNQGGDLDWFPAGMMVKPFNDACFLGEKGDIKVVTSQFGVHIIEILDQQGGQWHVDYAEYALKIEPGNYTFQQMYQRATEFAARVHKERPGWFKRMWGADKKYVVEAQAQFDAQVEADTLQLRSADGLERAWPGVRGLEESREIVRWAFEAKPGEVSKVFELPDAYVVAQLRSVEESKDGVSSYEAVRDEVEVAVRREKVVSLLRARVDSAQRAGATSVAQLADALGVRQGESAGVTSASYALGAEGYEPAVLGVALAMESGKVSKPVEGNGGIFVIETTQGRLEQNLNGNKEGEYASYLQDMRMRMGYGAYTALRQMSDVRDQRAKFY